MFPLTQEQLNNAIEELDIKRLTTATIRQISALSTRLEEMAGERAVHLEMGNPGLPAIRAGIEAQCEALRNGVPNIYPNIAGIPSLKTGGSRFLKAFADVDIPAKCIVPTVGSMQGCFTSLLLLGQLHKERNTICFINPGFPAQRNQAKLLGLNEVSFDLLDHRGDRLEPMLRRIFERGDIAAIIYSNPNNPAWTNLTEQELEVIGRLATEYDVIVLEDLAYMGMDFRRDLSHPFEPPYIPSVARYTDNYVLLMSASKIFSYAGERIALVCMSPVLYRRRYPFLEEFYEMPRYGDAYIFGVLYCVSSGTSHSAQYAMGRMLNMAADGELDFVAECRDYGRRAGIAKRLFTDNGFHIVYAYDGDEPISDGFFFTVGYDDMDSDELQRELMRYGISAISLPSTGSTHRGMRVCVSLLTDDATFDTLGRRLRLFNEHHCRNAVLHEEATI